MLLCDTFRWRGYRWILSGVLSRISSISSVQAKYEAPQRIMQITQNYVFRENEL